MFWVQGSALQHFHPLRFEEALKVNVHSNWDVNVIELNDVLEVLEVLKVEQKVRVEKLELEDTGHPVTKESHSEVRDLHCHSEHTYSIHMPADRTAIIQLNVVGEWASNLDHSSWDPD